MQTIALTTESQVEIISAYASTNQQIAAVSATPGWHVVGAFFLPASAPAKLDAIGVVSGSGLVLRVRLFDLVTAAPVTGSVVEITETIDTRKLSGIVQLVGNRTYQIQAECIGDSGFAVLKTATLV